MQPEQPPPVVGGRGRGAVGADLSEPWAGVFSGYRVVLERAPLSPRTRRAYASHVAGFLSWLQAGPVLAADVDPLRDPHGRDFAVRDYKSWLKSVRQVMPATINAYLAAIDHFYDEHLRVARLAATKRERLPDRAPEALDDVEQRKYLRAARRTNSARNIAIAYLLIYTGIGVEEARSLDVEDLAMSARRGKLTVWQGKGTDGGKYREVPLHTAVRSRLGAWLDERAELPAADTTGALFLSRLGARLSDRSIRTIVTELGTAAGLVHTEGPDAGQSKVHPQTLRHTFATQLIRSGVDVALVADLLGNASLDTTRVYTHASMADLERALEDNLITDD